MTQVLNVLKSGDYSTSLNREVYDKVPINSIVLDVGCWNGNLGARLIKDKACTVDGLDADSNQLVRAKERGYRNTYLVNLNSENPDFTSIQGPYDVIVFADVLEHLVNPAEVLVGLKKKLKPEGKIIVSLPNVAFILNRLNLLLGKWNYTEFGTLDKTHLRFFTLESGLSLVEKAGFQNAQVIPYNQFGILAKLHLLTRLVPKMIAYQFLVVATN